MAERWDITSQPYSPPTTLTDLSRRYQGREAREVIANAETKQAEIYAKGQLDADALRALTALHAGGNELIYATVQRFVRNSRASEDALVNDIMDQVGRTQAVIYTGQMMATLKVAGEEFNRIVRGSIEPKPKEEKKRRRLF